MSVDTYDLKSPKWQQTRNISENGFYTQVLDYHRPYKILCRTSGRVKITDHQRWCGSGSYLLMWRYPDPIFYCDADPDPASSFDADPEPTFSFDADPDPSFQIKAQNMEKVLKKAHIPYILAYHLQNWCGCGSSLSLWGRSGSSLSLWCRSGSGSQFSIWCGSIQTRILNTVLKFSWILSVGRNSLYIEACYVCQKKKNFEYILDVQLMIFCVTCFKHHDGWQL